MKEYYPELKPKERISAVLKEYIEPVLSNLGFKYFPSLMSFKRKIGEFTHIIEISSSHRNQTGVWCEFDVEVSIVAHNYNKWTKKNLGNSYNYAGIIGEKNESIPGYDLSDYMSGPMFVKYAIDEDNFDSSTGENSEPKEKTADYFREKEPEVTNVAMGYNLATSDNQAIIDSLKKNINKAIVPYLNKVTDYYDAINAVIEEGYYFKTPMLMDFCEILNDEKKSNDVYQWFQKEKDAGTDFYEETIDEVAMRKERLDKGYNKSSKPTPKSGGSLP